MFQVDAFQDSMAAMVGLPSGTYSACMDATALQSLVPCAAAQMPQAPQTITVDVSGAKKVRVLIVDPGNTIGLGTQSIRLDSEISTDGGQNWRLHGIDPWHAGQQLSTKSASIGYHYVEERAVVWESFTDATGHQCMRQAGAVFPAGTMFRWHLRQTADGMIGLMAEVER